MWSLCEGSSCRAKACQKIKETWNTYTCFVQALFKHPESKLSSFSILLCSPRVVGCATCTNKTSLWAWNLVMMSPSPFNRSATPWHSWPEFLSFLMRAQPACTTTIATMRFTNRASKRTQCLRPSLSTQKGPFQQVRSKLGHFECISQDASAGFDPWASQHWAWKASGERDLYPNATAARSGAFSAWSQRSFQSESSLRCPAQILQDRGHPATQSEPNPLKNYSANVSNHLTKVLRFSTHSFAKLDQKTPGQNRNHLRMSSSSPFTFSLGPPSPMISISTRRSQSVARPPLPTWSRKPQSADFSDFTGQQHR